MSKPGSEGKGAFLTREISGRPTRQPLKMIVATIMWQVAKADGRLDRREYHKIVELICIEFQLSREAASELINLAAFTTREFFDMADCFRQVRVGFSLEQRRHLYEAVWKIIKADQRLHDRELDFVAHLARNLDLQADILSD